MAAATLRNLGLRDQHVGIGNGNEPVWPDGTSGSISHSASRCACLVSNVSGRILGVDIEAFAEGAALSAIWENCLSGQETMLVEHQNIFSNSELATMVFSAKETLFKALYPVVNDFFGFNCAALVGLPEDGLLQLEMSTDLHQSFTQGTIIDIYFQMNTHHVLTWTGIAHSSDLAD